MGTTYFLYQYGTRTGSYRTVVGTSEYYVSTYYTVIGIIKLSWLPAGFTRHEMVRTGLPGRWLLFPRLPSQGGLLEPQESQYQVFSSAVECKAPSVATLQSSQDLSVTLVTQASADRLWMLPHICARWGSAPMIAVTLVRKDARADRLQLQSNSTCELTLLQLSTTQSNSDAPEAYPINWLRNQGILCVKTTHYFVVDVDFWPSVELLAAIRAQLRDWGNARKALIVPNFQRSGHGARSRSGDHLATI